MFKFSVQNRVKNPTYTVYEINFYHLTLTPIGKPEVCDNAIYPAPSVNSIIDMIVKHIDYVNITLNDVYVGHVDQWIDIYSDPNQAPNPILNEFMKHAKILGVYGVDASECNSYLVVVD